MSDKNIRFALHTHYLFFDYYSGMIKIGLADYVYYCDMIKIGLADYVYYCGMIKIGLADYVCSIMSGFGIKKIHYKISG